MRLLALNGSPRGRRSNTERLLQPVLTGAKEAGADVQRVYLGDLDIQPCRGCLSCWLQTPGRCVQHDDMPELLVHMLASDGLVLGFPLYFYGVPTGVQAMLERTLPLARPDLMEGEEGTFHPSRYPDWHSTWVVISNCGFPEQDSFDALRLKFGHMGVEPICMAAGEFLSFMEDDPEMADALEELRSDLQALGAALARDEGIPDELRSALDRPLIERAGVSPAEYREIGNRAFRAALEEADGDEEPDPDG